MSAYILNDNECICGHPRAEHIYQGNLSPRWCGLNLKVCDCWDYKAKEVPKKDVWICDL